MTSADVPSHVDLTPRESEVLAMVAEGKTNREIGAALYISESTAGVHVSNILAKLGVASRTEAAAIAIRAGLLESATEPAEGEAQPEPEPALAPAEPEPTGWRARIRAQMRRHPRSTAVAGGTVVVLAALTTGLAFAVLTSDRPTGVADASTSPSAVTGSSAATQAALATFPQTPTPSPTPPSSGAPSPTPSSSGTPSPTPSAAPSATATPRPAPTRTPAAIAAPSPSPNNTWTAAGDGVDGRTLSTATLLPDGSVLIVGGRTVMEINCTTLVERYYPRTKVWTEEEPMTDRRCAHTATLEDDGKVLVAGGMSGYALPLATVERYDPITGTWTVGAEMPTRRSHHTATTLSDGRVLVLGGRGDDEAILASADIYDPRTGSWTPTGVLADARVSHTAARLPDGSVLVAGGSNDCCNSPLSSAEIFDPGSETWSRDESMYRRRSGAAALSWQSGVLVVGGDDGSTVLGSAEIYDPSAPIGSRWHAVGSVRVGGYGSTLTQLENGDVLVIGGLTDVSPEQVGAVQRFDYPTNNGWVEDGRLPISLYEHTATLLDDGTVLVVGGRNVRDSDDEFGALLYIPMAER